MVSVALLYEGLTIEEAMNELTLLATGIYGHDLPVQHGTPIRLVTPWKYGYKSIKPIVLIELVNEKPRTFWNDEAPSEYGFYANVNPYIPHLRWSQATERMLVQTKNERPCCTTAMRLMSPICIRLRGAEIC